MNNDMTPYMMPSERSTAAALLAGYVRSKRLATGDAERWSLFNPPKGAGDSHQKYLFAEYFADTIALTIVWMMSTGQLRSIDDAFKEQMREKVLNKTFEKVATRMTEMELNVSDANRHVIEDESSDYSRQYREAYDKNYQAMVSQRTNLFYLFAGGSFFGNLLYQRIHDYVNDNEPTPITEKLLAKTATVAATYMLVDVARRNEFTRPFIHQLDYLLGSALTNLPKLFVHPAAYAADITRYMPERVRRALPQRIQEMHENPPETEGILNFFGRKREGTRTLSEDRDDTILFSFNEHLHLPKFGVKARPVEKNMKLNNMAAESSLTLIAKGENEERVPHLYTIEEVIRSFYRYVEAQVLARHDMTEAALDAMPPRKQSMIRSEIRHHFIQTFFPAQDPAKAKQLNLREGYLNVNQRGLDVYNLTRGLEKGKFIDTLVTEVSRFRIRNAESLEHNLTRAVIDMRARGYTYVVKDDADKPYSIERYSTIDPETGHPQYDEAGEYGGQFAEAFAHADPFADTAINVLRHNYKSNALDHFIELLDYLADTFDRIDDRTMKQRDRLLERISERSEARHMEVVVHDLMIDSHMEQLAYRDGVLRAIEQLALHYHDYREKLGDKRHSDDPYDKLATLEHKRIFADDLFVGKGVARNVRPMIAILDESRAFRLVDHARTASDVTVDKEAEKKARDSVIKENTRLFGATMVNLLILVDPLGARINGFAQMHLMEWRYKRILNRYTRFSEKLDFAGAPEFSLERLMELYEIRERDGQSMSRKERREMRSLEQTFDKAAQDFQKLAGHTDRLLGAFEQGKISNANLRLLKDMLPVVAGDVALLDEMEREGRGELVERIERLVPKLGVMLPSLVERKARRDGYAEASARSDQTLQGLSQATSPLPQGSTTPDRHLPQTASQHTQAADTSEGLDALLQQLAAERQERQRMEKVVTSNNVEMRELQQRIDQLEGLVRQHLGTTSATEETLASTMHAPKPPLHS